MIIIYTETIYGLEHVLINDLNFSGVIRSTIEFDFTVFENNYDISSDYNAGIIDAIYYKIYELTLIHLEFLAQMMEQEANICLKMSNNQIQNRLDYVLKLSIVEKQLILMKNLIKPKAFVLSEILTSKSIDENLKYFLLSLKSRIKEIKRKAKCCSGLIKNAEQIYNSFVEFDISKNNQKINKTMKYFSAISTMFHLITFVDGAFGMNITIPGGDEDSYWPFIAIFIFCLVDIVVFYSFFKYKKWI